MANVHQTKSKKYVESPRIILHLVHQKIFVFFSLIMVYFWPKFAPNKSVVYIYMSMCKVIRTYQVFSEKDCGPRSTIFGTIALDPLYFEAHIFSYPLDTPYMSKKSPNVLF